MIDDFPRIHEEEDCTGLTEAEVQHRLEKDGPNELPSARKRRFWHILLDVVREPMFLMLIACGVLYLVLGDMEEALMLLGFVFVIMAITLYQEQKTERALEALRDLSSPRALVIRDGRRQRIAGRDVVRDDIVIIAEGDRVPADAVLLAGTNVSVDESLLTGESVPGEKSGLGRRSADGPPGRGRPALRLFGDPGRQGPGHRPRGSHRPPDRDRQDRQGPPDPRAGGNDAPAADRPDRQEFRPPRPRPVRRGRRRVHADPGQSASAGSWPA